MCIRCGKVEGEPQVAMRTGSENQGMK